MVTERLAHPEPQTLRKGEPLAVNPNNASIHGERVVDATLMESRIPGTPCEEAGEHPAEILDRIVAHMLRCIHDERILGPLDGVKPLLDAVEVVLHTIPVVGHPAVKAHVVGETRDSDPLPERGFGSVVHPEPRLERALHHSSPRRSLEVLYRLRPHNLHE